MQIKHAARQTVPTNESDIDREEAIYTDEYTQLPSFGAAPLCLTCMQRD